MALVTGGASGLGRATVEGLVQKGSSVVFCDLPTSAGSQLVKDLGERVHYVPADVTSEADVKNLVDEVANKFKKLDVLVNCAGRANAYITYNFNTKEPRTLQDFQLILQVKPYADFFVDNFHDLLSPNSDKCFGHLQCDTPSSWINCPK